MLELPKIRIEVEGMKYQIIHAFGSHNDEIEKYVADELNKVLETYPFAEEVAKVSKQVLTEAIKHSVQEFLLYGEGRKVLDEVVADLLKSVIQKS